MLLQHGMFVPPTEGQHIRSALANPHSTHVGCPEHRAESSALSVGDGVTKVLVRLATRDPISVTLDASLTHLSAAEVYVACLHWFDVAMYVYKSHPEAPGTPRRASSPAASHAAWQSCHDEPSA